MIDMDGKATLSLVALSSGNFEALFNFELENIAWFEKWVPPRPESYWDYSAFVAACEGLIREVQEGKAIYCLGMLGNEIVGRFNLSDISNGTASLGYRIAEAHAGKGLATQFAKLLLNQASKAGIKTIYAQALEENLASTAILKKLGFSNIASDTETVALNGRTFHLASYELIID